ncbi:hypothetical protein [Microbacterium sp. NPDC076911]|uniref:hypothetical protein n=1 Tax=Microbacterium sp. NPDC076911 TaxID=3154958 RepID=UPI003419F4CF
MSDSTPDQSPVPPPAAAASGWTAPSARPFAPPAGYSMPPGYSAPPTQHLGTSVPAAPPAQKRGAALGVVALLLSLFAVVIVPLVLGVTAFEIGQGALTQNVLTTAQFSPEALTPVRGWVLFAEITFWTGTVCGIWALTQGIVAIVRRRGRGAGIAAVVLASAGPLIALVVGFSALAVGATMNMGG